MEQNELKKTRKKIFSQLNRVEKQLENALLMIDGELPVDAIALLYKSVDTIIRTLIELKQNPSADFQRNIQILKQEYGNEKFLNKDTFSFIKSLSEMNRHYQEELEPSYSDAVIKENFQETERLLKSAQTFLKSQLLTEKERKHEKRIKNLIFGLLGTGGAALVVFLIIQVFQSLWGTRNGLLAQYYNNLNLTGSPVVERVDKNINFIWGDKTPHPRITKGFSARWQGQIILDKSGDYVFTVQSDEGLKFFIDKISLINTWSMKDRPPQSSAKIHLNKGVHEIKLEYFFNQKHAALKLLWSSDYFPRKTVKNKVLYPPGKLEETQ